MDQLSMVGEDQPCLDTNVGRLDDVVTQHIIIIANMPRHYLMRGCESDCLQVYSDPH